MNATYKLFCSLDEPVTPRSLLNRMCVRHDKTIPCYYRSYAEDGLIKPHKGMNIAPFGNDIIYFPGLFTYSVT